MEAKVSGGGSGGKWPQSRNPCACVASASRPYGGLRLLSRRPREIDGRFGAAPGGDLYRAHLGPSPSVDPPRPLVPIPSAFCCALLSPRPSASPRSTRPYSLVASLDKEFSRPLF
uniref:Uncharacterized protein n=1 Tax=Plectus sambesii TaxID=2011161 RepID=A0A914VLS9_9BILA